MKVLGIVSFVFVCTVVQAYDFEDSIYNHILLNELDEIQWDTNKLNPRSRRDVVTPTCTSKHFRSCCEEDYFRELYKEDKPLKKECYKEITGKDLQDSIIDLLKCEKSDEFKRDIACIAECAAKKRGIVDEEGNLIEAEVKKMFEEKSAKIEWLMAQEGICAKCFAKANAAGKLPRGKDQCNPANIKYEHCIWKEIQSACPADRITDEGKCKKIRENIDSLEEYVS